MLVTFAAWTGASASFAQTGSSSASGTVTAMNFLYCPSSPCWHFGRPVLQRRAAHVPLLPYRRCISDKTNS
jgi:hypothetical protein